MKKPPFFVGLAALLLGATFLLLPEFFVHPPLPREVTLRGKTYTLEVADTEAKRALGLGGRDSLCDTCAMLFVFGLPGERAFWMKDMRFPLDIAWLHDDTIVHIEHRIPADSGAVFRPSALADRVLEFRAGALDDLQAGEKVMFSFSQ